MMTTVRPRDPLVVYLILAFAGTWGIGLTLLAAGARLDGAATALWLIVVSLIPGAAAVVASRRDPSAARWRDLAGRTRTWRVGVGWYVLAVGVPLAAVIAAAAVSLSLGIAITPEPTILATVPIILLVNFAEEIGWRGFTLPALLDRMGAIRASLGLGLLWFAWHIPVQLLAPSEDKLLVMVALLLQLTGLSILLTWLFNHARGAVVIAAVAHAAFNVGGNVLPFVAVEGQLVLGATCLFMAGIVIVVGGPELRWPGHPSGVQRETSAAG